MKKKGSLFFKSFYLSFICALCLFIFFYGISKAYTKVRKTGFSDDRKAVEISKNGIKILDFEFEF